MAHPGYLLTSSALHRSRRSLRLAQRRRGHRYVSWIQLGMFSNCGRLSAFTGDVKFGKGGEWEQGRMLQVQYRDIKSGDLEQFRGMDTQTVLTPSQYKTGDLIYPYEKAK